MKKAVFCFIAVVLAFAACSERANSPQGVLGNYISYINKQNLVQANFLWDSTACRNDSLPDWHFAWPSDGKLAFPALKPDAIKIISSDQSYAGLEIPSDSNQGSASLKYYIRNTKDGWKLVNPPFALCAAWDSVVINEIIIKYKGNRPDDRFYQTLFSMYSYTKTILGSTDTAKIHIYLTDSNDRVAELASQTKPLLSWSAPACGVVIFNGSAIGNTPDTALLGARIAATELAHVVAYNIGKIDPLQCPLLRDGLATYLWGIEGIPANAILSYAEKNYALFPELDSLIDTRYYYRDEKTNSAYAATFVDFLVVTYGLDKFKEIYGAASSADNFRVALQTLDDLKILDAAWKTFIKKKNIVDANKKNNNKHG